MCKILVLQQGGAHVTCGSNVSSTFNNNFIMFVNVSSLCTANSSLKVIAMPPPSGVSLNCGSFTSNSGHIYIDLTLNFCC